MIIRTKVDGSRGVQTKYYKYMGGDGKAVLCGMHDAAKFDEATAAKVLSHLKLVDHRFVHGEVVA